MTDRGVARLGILKDLELLRMIDCFSVTPDAVAELRSTMPGVKIVYNALSPETLAMWEAFLQLRNRDPKETRPLLAPLDPTGEPVQYDAERSEDQSSEDKASP